MLLVPVLLRVSFTVLDHKCPVERRLAGAISPQPQHRALHEREGWREGGMGDCWKKLQNIPWTASKYKFSDTELQISFSGMKGYVLGEHLSHCPAA